MSDGIPTDLLTSIYAAIDEFNALQRADARLDKRPETRLLGPDARLDSLGLVSFLIGVEQRVSTDFGVALTLADEKAFSMRNSPFVSVASLATYVGELLEEAQRA